MMFSNVDFEMRLAWNIRVDPRCDHKCLCKTEAEGDLVTGGYLTTEASLQRLENAMWMVLKVEKGHEPKDAGNAAPEAGDRKSVV